MEMREEEVVSRTIVATRENAAEMQALVREWPELDALVRQLLAADLFPGIRNLSIRLMGSSQAVGKGLGAVLGKNAAAVDMETHDGN